MSTELKQAAQQALKELDEARKIVRASSSRQLAKDWDRRATDALANLRTAILALRPERVPMTPEQINEMALQEEFLLVCDGVEELTEIVRAVEAHQGITPKKETT